MISKSTHVPIPFAFRNYINEKIFPLNQRSLSFIQLGQESHVNPQLLRDLSSGTAIRISRISWEKLRHYFEIPERNLEDINLRPYED